MASGENPVWLPDYGLIDMDDVGNFAGDFPCTVAADEFYSALGAVPEISPEVSGSFEGSDYHGKSCQLKRRTESCGAYGSKASREKLRRDKLNDRFLELGCLLEPGKKPKTDKSTILCDAIRVVNQLRNDAEKRKEENEQLEEKVKELKAEKSELREEKLKLKADKERLEQQMKAITMPAGFLPHPAAFQAAFAAQAPAPGVKPMPFMGYPAMPMWQFLPPALVDSSKDPAGVSPGA
ncbi:transcription factor bHLH115-like isoform X2 [Nymphaea colorata]|uniref:transcription factor bHLH115-like isoform X2 n=1 Tax=Nymphaea colorata TaxID=210225 RepID=UPI00129ECBB0|nr:transcription factor bHLH115-like isoform X2 [Nymphaea colorata]